MSTLARIALLSSLTLLAGCGKEAGRVPFAGEGSSSAVVALKAGEVDFWTDISIDYEGDASMHYTIDLEQGGSSVAKATCYPLGRLSVKLSWSESNLGSSHSRSGSGKMACSVQLASAGSTTVKASLAFGQKPSSVKLTKADLVLKQ